MKTIILLFFVVTIGCHRWNKEDFQIVSISEHSAHIKWENKLRREEIDFKQSGVVVFIFRNVFAGFYVPLVALPQLPFQASEETIQCPTLVEYAFSADPGLRVVAMQILSHPNIKLKKETCALFVDLSYDEQPEIRAYTMAALAKIGTTQAVLGLIRGLSDKSPYVRESAAHGLGQIKFYKKTADLARKNTLASNKESDYYSESMALLKKSLSHKNPKIRKLAVRSLGKVGSDMASDIEDHSIWLKIIFKALKKQLLNQNPKVQYEASVALFKIEQSFGK